MNVVLSAAKRAVTGKGVVALRAEGKMPAVLYGASTANTPIEVSRKEFEKVYKKAGESSVVTLSLDGETHSVLIHEVSYDPVSHMVSHADFYAVKKGQKVEVEVPLSFVGVSPAVKEKGANLVSVMHEITIEGDATNLPHEIEVDISVLSEVDDHILAKDIRLPSGVSLITKPDEVVAIASAPEEEREEVASVDMSAIGISEERGKKEEESASE